MSQKSDVLGEINENGETEAKLEVPEDDAEKKPPRTTALESLRCCLFCNEEHEGVKKCLDHMRLKHSFTILDIDCLVDLKGLLTYMAQRIHIGYLCLFCSKQFSDARRCQQHMCDKSHCIMNMEDEEEYLDFYDFSKTYENHPLLVKDSTLAIKEGNAKEEQDEDREDDGWEDCDVDDAASGEEEGDEEKADTSKSFSIVEKPETDSSQSFQIVDKPDTETSKSFSIADKSGTVTYDEDEFTINSSSKQSEQKGAGVSREEVFLGLKIKKAKLLDNGEVLLGNGKIMGHRQYHYLYKQRPRLPDMREAVVINKIALEYRKLRALQNAGGKQGQLIRSFMNPAQREADLKSFQGRKQEQKFMQKQ